MDFLKLVFYLCFYKSRASTRSSQGRGAPREGHPKGTPHDEGFGAEEGVDLPPPHDEGFGAGGARRMIRGGYT